MGIIQLRTNIGLWVFVSILESKVLRGLLDRKGMQFKVAEPLNVYMYPCLIEHHIFFKTRDWLKTQETKVEFMPLPNKMLKI